MPRNYNISLFESAISKFNIKDGIFFRTELPWTLTPVVQVEPISKISRSSTVTTTGGGGTYTTPADKDFYLTSCTLSLIKNATCDAASGSATVTATIDGQSVTLLALPILTLTAQSDQIAVMYNPPLKIDRNTQIIMTGVSFTAGAKVQTNTISGYIENTL